MSKIPPSDDLRLAAEWLDENEGEAGESDSCKLVAKYLRRLADRLDDETTLRAAIRKSGMVPTPTICAKFRRILKKYEK